MYVVSGWRGGGGVFYMVGVCMVYGGGVGCVRSGVGVYMVGGWMGGGGKPIRLAPLTLCSVHAWVFGSCCSHRLSYSVTQQGPNPVADPEGGRRICPTAHCLHAAPPIE